VTPTDAEIVRSAAIVARYLPGVHDPLGMDTSDLNILAEAVGDVLRIERGTSSGKDSHRARVENEMRRIHG
jgi:hypothetical protein